MEPNSLDAISRVTGKMSGSGREGSYPFPVAVGSNQSTLQGQPLGSIKSRTSLFIANTVPAGEVLPVPCQGTQFYVTAATGKIAIRPRGGAFNEYTEGTGLQLDEVNAFDLLEIKNLTSFPVVFQCFVGFDGFLDKRLYLVNKTQPIVARPTYPVASTANEIDIDDISGQAFQDINGNNWLALARVALIICNTDSGNTILLQAADTVTANGPAIAAVYPLTSLRLEVTGNYRLSSGGGGNINVIVSELYQSIPAI